MPEHKLYLGPAEMNADALFVRIAGLSRVRLPVQTFARAHRLNEYHGVTGRRVGRETPIVPEATRACAGAPASGPISSTRIVYTDRNGGGFVTLPTEYTTNDQGYYYITISDPTVMANAVNTSLLIQARDGAYAQVRVGELGALYTLTVQMQTGSIQTGTRPQIHSVGAATDGRASMLAQGHPCGGQPQT